MWLAPLTHGVWVGDLPLHPASGDVVSPAWQPYHFGVAGGFPLPLQVVLFVICFLVFLGWFDAFPLAIWGPWQQLPINLYDFFWISVKVIIFTFPHSFLGWCSLVSKDVLTRVGLLSGRISLPFNTYLVSLLSYFLNSKARVGQWYSSVFKVSSGSRREWGVRKENFWNSERLSPETDVFTLTCHLLFLYGVHLHEYGPSVTPPDWVAQRFVV